MSPAAPPDVRPGRHEGKRSLLARAAGGVPVTLNAGSSSLKFALFGTETGLTATMRGAIGELDSAPHLVARASAALAERRWPAGGAPPLADLLGTCRKQPISTTSATAPRTRPS